MKLSRGGVGPAPRFAPVVAAPADVGPATATKNVSTAIHIRFHPVIVRLLSALARGRR